MVAIKPTCDNCCNKSGRIYEAYSDKLLCLLFQNEVSHA